MKGVSNYKLRIYKEVAERLSFTDASIALGISQASVSKVVSDVEEGFSEALIVRSTTKVELTPAGRVVLRYASDTLALEERVRLELILLEDDFDGKIAIGVEGVSIRGYIDDLLNRFGALFPRIEFRIVSDSRDNIMEELDRGELDVAFLKNERSAGTTPYCVEVRKDERARYVDSFLKFAMSDNSLS